MREIITEIQKALAAVTTEKPLQTSLIDGLSRSLFLWKPDYPIALIHTKERIEESSDVAALENGQLFDNDGDTPQHPTLAQLDAIRAVSPNCLQCVALMALKNEPQHIPLFQVKRQNDYWKKIQEVGHIKAMVELSAWQEDVGVCDVEFALREIIRKRKEVHALKDVGFIWIAAAPNDVSEVFRHYFHDNYAYVPAHQQGFHVGWSPTLRAVSMRSFVCPPK